MKLGRISYDKWKEDGSLFELVAEKLSFICVGAKPSLVLYSMLSSA